MSLIIKSRMGLSLRMEGKLFRVFFQVAWYGSGWCEYAGSCTGTTGGTGWQDHDCRVRFSWRCLHHWVTVSRHTNDYPVEGTSGCCKAAHGWRHLYWTWVPTEEPSEESVLQQIQGQPIRKDRGDRTLSQVPLREPWAQICHLDVNGLSPSVPLHKNTGLPRRRVDR